MFGSNQSEYLDRKNFNGNKKHAATLSWLLGNLDGLANKNHDYLYIVHQRRRHGNVPLWVLVNAMTFGAISKFYLLTDFDIQTKVSSCFVGVDERCMAGMLNILSKFRNVCSHNERLIHYRTRNDIPDMPLHAKLNIKKKGKQHICGKRDFFAVVIALRYLLPDGDFKAFKRSLVRAINKYLRSTAAISEGDLNSMLGLPTNWESITRYTK